MTRKNLIFLIIGLFGFYQSWGQYPEIENELDNKVKTFLKDNADNWGDMNVPLSDGRILYDIIIKNKYINAV